MKKTALLLFIFATTSLLTISGQENADTLKTERNYSPLSIELSYSPHYAFSFNPTTISRPFRDFWLGVSGRLVYKVDSERTSISIGVTYRRKKIVQSSPGNYDIATLLEVPIQVDYHLKKIVDKFDPYLKSSLRVCQFKVNYIGYTEGAIPSNYLDYLLLVDIGYGSTIKINKNLHVFFESSLGYGLTDVLPNRAYLDLLIGINLNL
ncbi:MAG: hypothetical protein ABR927_18970 [Bacteroidales bacterium]|jgi:hypothetical protein